jgi:hypothetical protein
MFFKGWGRILEERLRLSKTYLKGWWVGIDRKMREFKRANSPKVQSYGEFKRGVSPSSI